MELIVVLGIASIVILAAIGGSLFVQTFLAKWKSADRLAEELAFLRAELTTRIEGAQQILFRGDSLVFALNNFKTVTYRHSDGELYRQGNLLTSAGIHLTSLSIRPISLRNSVTDTILSTTGQGDTPQCLYQLRLTLSDDNGNVRTLTATVRNEYAYYKGNAAAAY